MTPAIDEPVPAMMPPHAAVAVTLYDGHFPDAGPVLLGIEQRFHKKMTYQKTGEVDVPRRIFVCYAILI